MKDFSKCGLTCPLILTEVIIKLINEVFELQLPERFYYGIIETPEGKFEMRRGYILGMANYMFSLI